MEVIDPAHPLCGKRFRLVSIERTTCPETCARVEWRFGLTLLLLLHVTNLGPRRERPIAQTKRSIEALEELVAVAEGSDGACPSSLGRSGVIYRQRSAGRSFELHTIRGRLTAGLLAKPERGECRSAASWRCSFQLAWCVIPQAWLRRTRTVKSGSGSRLSSESFLSVRTAVKVTRTLAARGLALPRRDGHG